jgi:hypothetical protein
MLWSGSSLFVTMEFVLGQVFGGGRRGFLPQRVMAFLMTLLFVAIVVTVLANTLLALVHTLPWLGPVVGALLWVGFMLTVYRLVPDRTLTVRLLWPGPVLAGVQMDVLTLAWPLNTRLSHILDLWIGLRSLLPARGVALPALPAHPSRRSRQPHAKRRRPDEGGARLIVRLRWTLLPTPPASADRPRRGGGSGGTTSPERLKRL